MWEGVGKTYRGEGDRKLFSEGGLLVRFAPPFFLLPPWRSLVGLSCLQKCNFLKFLVKFDLELGVLKAGCFKPGCLQFLHRSALLPLFAPGCGVLLCSCGCAHLRLSASGCVENDSLREFQRNI